MSVRDRMGTAEIAVTRHETWLKAFRLSADNNLVMAVAVYRIDPVFAALFSVEGRIVHANVLLPKKGPPDEPR